jgi:hypothetical protein
MKSLFLGLSAAVVAGVVAAGALAAERYDAAAAIAGEGDTCGLPGAEADGDLILVGGLGTVTNLIERPSRVTMQCKGTGITNLSGSGQSFSGFPCTIAASGGVFETFDSSATVSPNGNGRLTCTYRP